MPGKEWFTLSLCSIYTHAFAVHIIFLFKYKINGTSSLSALTILIIHDFFLIEITLNQSLDTTI